jgi:hypothetical protein
MMPSKIASLVGYPKVPAAKYMLRHPVKGTKALVAAKGAKGLVTTPAGAVLGGLVAVPLSLLLLKRRRNSDEG